MKKWLVKDFTKLVSNVLDDYADEYRLSQREHDKLFDARNNAIAKTGKFIKRSPRERELDKRLIELDKAIGGMEILSWRAAKRARLY